MECKSDLNSKRYYCVQDDNGFTFVPPVYVQRYYSVCDVLTNEKFEGCIKKVVDFGCSNLKFFQFLKRLGFIEHVVEVDIDETILSQRIKDVEPLLCDYLGYQDFQLIVEIFVGSISEKDYRLKSSDAVVCIELIEHLYPDVLEKVPEVVFGFIKPRVAIFTTPNADFNVLFKLTGFRNEDHKFEWTRKEFRDWSKNIILQYPDYDVYFVGIGPGPAGTEELGCCTQMAVFSLKNSSKGPIGVDKIMNEMPYKLLKRCEYPYTKDLRTTQEKFNHKLEYWINRLIEYNDGDNDDEQYDNFAYIALKELLPYVKEWCPTEDILRERLLNTKWTVMKMENEYKIKVDRYPEFDDDRNSDS